LIISVPFSPGEPHGGSGRRSRFGATVRNARQPCAVHRRSDRTIYDHRKTGSRKPCLARLALGARDQSDELGKQAFQRMLNTKAAAVEMILKGASQGGFLIA
jgi:hypothetical protein